MNLANVRDNFSRGRKLGANAGELKHHIAQLK